MSKKKGQFFWYMQKKKGRNLNKASLWRTRKRTRNNNNNSHNKSGEERKDEKKE